MRVLSVVKHNLIKGSIKNQQYHQFLSFFSKIWIVCALAAKSMASVAAPAQFRFGHNPVVAVKQNPAVLQPTPLKSEKSVVRKKRKIVTRTETVKEQRAAPLPRLPASPVLAIEPP